MLRVTIHYHTMKTVEFLAHTHKSYLKVHLPALIGAACTETLHNSTAITSTNTILEHDDSKLSER